MSTSVSVPVGYAVFRYAQRTARMALYHVTISYSGRRETELRQSHGSPISIVVKAHLSTLVINVDASSVIVFLIGDLQPVRMINLFWLKHGIQVLYGDYSFRAFGFLDDGILGHFRVRAICGKHRGNYSICSFRTHIFLVVVRQSKFSLYQHKLPLQKLHFLFPFLPQNPFIETWGQVKTSPRSRSFLTYTNLNSPVLLKHSYFFVLPLI